MSYLDCIPSTKNSVFSVSPDCHISKLNNKTRIATSLDFFYPLVDDPYLQGQITTCNVLSDIYAMGITRIDHMLVILGLSDQMTEEQRRYAATEIMKGMKDKAEEAKCFIAGGQTVLNPWVMTGGSVIGVIEDLNLQNTEAEAGDVIILTKPLGMQMAVNFKQYIRKNPDKIQKLISTGHFDLDSFDHIFQKAAKHMATLNLYAAQVINEFKDHVKACTDITGFGIKGHSDNLVEIQKRNVNFLIDTFPTFTNFHKLDKIVRNFKLLEGLAAETSGGLFIVVSKDFADKFQQSLKRNHNIESWIIGKVVNGNRVTEMANNLNILEV